ncbi:uncharacterized protein F5Z01DRAFT_676993 [Emericellopsis atlantica]|uniref:Uncharacterized protein n=1 Tax=Emericellopsis atlantica TaxID=2614577 RepID=A0A9P7ZGD6_9HYPO|nr:uncharacterized protein F5Z01DRAFT_676993 [Emericellopsis atlantica]KAG9251241.1 hypothetical protein F5Z01DRAFT_676993 [Emericellopsis atlantica]
MAQGAVKPRVKGNAAKVVHSKRQASKVSKPKKTPKQNADRVNRKFTSGMGKKGKNKASSLGKGGSKKFG